MFEGLVDHRLITQQEYAEVTYEGSNIESESEPRPSGVVTIETRNLQWLPTLRLA
jgi:hypothetical protein